MSEALTEPIPMPVRRSFPLDPPDAYRWLRAEHPVSRLRLPGGKVGWLLTRYADVRAVLADRRFTPSPILPSPEHNMPFTEEVLKVPPGLFAAMDPPEHTRYRKLVAGQFTLNRVRKLSQWIEQVVDEQLDAIVRNGPPADLVEAFALPVPSLVISELLGVPAGDRGEFCRLSSTMLSLAAETDTRLAAHDQIYQNMHELVLAKRTKPTDDLLCGLIQSGAPPLTDEELVNIGVLLLITGQETTVHMLALSIFALLQHPEQLAMLRADPGLLDQANDELLRYLSILQFGLTRIAREDVDIAGHRIRAGQTVIVSLSAANRDPENFSDPDRLDISRTHSPHLAFGHGLHQCLGAHLARVEMKIALGALLRRLSNLRLATPVEMVPLRTDMVIYGVHKLLVTWD